MQPQRAVVVVLALASAFACRASVPPVSGGSPPASSAAGSAQVAKVVAVEVFDTNPNGAERVLIRHGDALALLRAEKSDITASLRVLVDEIRADGGYAYVESAMVTYFQPDAVYVTIDLVDSEDVAQRMPFLIRPTGTYADPAGLLASWEHYEEKFINLLSRGEISGRPVDCPAFHCLGDPRHPALRLLADEIATRAPGHVDELATILHDDHRDDSRATAAYLLAYASDGHTVVSHLVPALRDASALVRNNAMRVLAEIALRHPEVDVPLDPVIEALRYPATSDRNKAAATLDWLLGRPGAAALYRRVARDAGSTLLAMLRLQQPNNHDFAYSILKKISGEVYGERDYAAWQAWIGRAAM